MSRAFDQLQKGSLMFPVASGLRGMGRWGWHREEGPGHGKEVRAPVAGEVGMVLGRGDHGTYELQRC